MGHSLDNLTIKGFKSIRELENFGLRRLNVIIGANGSGKSNLVDFFRMISAMMKIDGLKEFIAGNADAYLYGGPKQTSAIVVKMVFGDNGYDFDLVPTPDVFFTINDEKRHWFPRNSTRYLGSGNFNPVLLDDRHNSELQSVHGASWYTYEAICSWKIYHFHDTSVASGMRRYQEQNHNESLAVDGANIAPYLLGLRQRYQEYYQRILDSVRLVIPFFDDFILEPNSNEKLRLDWRQKGLNDYPMRPTHLSDGSIRFICLATALLQPNPPSTIIIDEPELGLHPSAIALLAELIISASSQTQIIIATQSTALIDQFAVEDIIVANRKDGATVLERLKENDLTTWLEDYSLGELWSKNIIDGGPVYNE